MILQRKRKACIGETLKTGSRQAVIGLRLSEPLFQVVNGTSLEYIQQVRLPSFMRSSSTSISLKPQDIIYHFNLPGHSVSDMRVTILEKIHSSDPLVRKEMAARGLERGVPLDFWVLLSTFAK